MTSPPPVTIAPGLVPGPDPAFDDALAADAAAAGPEAPPQAPWLNADGSPRWGLKADGTPRRSKPGPGRGGAAGKDGRPRVETPPPPGTAGGGGPPRSYREELEGAHTVIWLGLAATPPTRAYATVWASQADGLVHAWDKAAQANPAVRGFVERYLTGSGSWAWVAPVALSSIPLATGAIMTARDPELRAQLAAQAEADLRAYMSAAAATVAASAAEHEAEAAQAAEGAQEAGE